MEKQSLNQNGNKEQEAPGLWLELFPLTEAAIPSYMKTGRESYREHYCHLWPGANPDPYLKRNFTVPILEAELKDARYLCWLIQYRGEAAGICKLDLQKDCSFHPTERSMFIEKIYFRKACTGKGLGRLVFQRIVDLARSLDRDFLWLEAMQEGPALLFYEKNDLES